MEFFVNFNVNYFCLNKFVIFIDICKLGVYFFVDNYIVVVVRIIVFLFCLKLVRVSFLNLDLLFFVCFRFIIILRFVIKIF